MIAQRNNVMIKGWQLSFINLEKGKECHVHPSRDDKAWPETLPEIPNLYRGDTDTASSNRVVSIPSLARQQNDYNILVSSTTTSITSRSTTTFSLFVCCIWVITSGSGGSVLV